MNVSSGVLLVGHGTRDTQGTAEFFQLSDLLAARLAGDAVVRPCLLEFQQPTIAQAWESLVRRGVDQVTVAPLLLFAAGHAKGDIPGEVAAAQASTGSSSLVRVRYARPISRQAAMVEAVRERLRETISRGASDIGTSGRTAVVMVGRGSRDVCASADMRLLSEVAVRGRSMTTTHSIAAEFGVAADGLWTTFYAMAEPRLTDTLNEVAAAGRFDRIVVHPHLLFAGRLYDAIAEQTDRAASAHPGIQFDVAPYLGPCDWVARALAAQIHQADLAVPTRAVDQ
ncbi:sirohydrochlorin chelatase [Allorhodopirellula solitaria]|uniref:Sirohydrochlorin cobaltochelatase n=1 Tax=Allorhodopirellula solitaria TaxID=2527987 RepID=A0A5C5WYZ2_9BACT|nr:sirohydrochlorin chelatase [Allorhodopirellula solitaria]TWT55937.1 Sirohydrochlorin cobaltochelatase [Allorhodopirellula solitaria]